MKIIHFISGGDVGGAKTHVLSLIAGLQQTETVKLVCFMEGDFAKDARALGIDVQIEDGGMRSTVKSLASQIAREGYQVIHCHGARANLVATLMRGKVNVPIITTVHSDYRLDYLGRTFHRLTYGTINTFCLRRIPYHIGVSQSMVRLLTRRGFDPQKMYAIYNGVSFAEGTPSMSRQDYLTSLGVDRDCITYGIAARLSAVKDVGTLIRGFSVAVQQCPNIRLVIAGDGEQRAELETLAKETCPAGTVTFAGWVEDMNSFYNAMDVNTLTSLSETFPYALTEGARQKCATIASCVGGVPDLIEDGICGMLFPSTDHQALGACMVKLATDATLRIRLGEELYAKVRDEFSVEVTVSRQREIYQALLRKHNRPKSKRDGVLICGAYGKGNAGDDSILEAIVSQMREIDQDMPLCVLTRTPKETKIRYGIEAIHTFDVLGFWRKMGKTKLYINGGGSLIQDVTSSRSLGYYLYNISLAKRRGNKVLMYGCGIGPVARPANLKKAGRVIDRYVDAITLREDTSRKLLATMGVTHPQISVTADPALLMPPCAPRKVEAYLQSHGMTQDKSYLLFGLRPWDGMGEKLDVFVQVANWAYETLGLTPVFLAMEPYRDMAVAEEAAGLVAGPALALPVPQEGGLILGLMERVNAVVSMRLHALIFAAAVGTPVVGTSYDPKVTSFLEYLGNSRCLTFEDLTLEALQQQVTQALADGNAAQEKVDVLRNMAVKNGEIARKLLEETK